jgi:hypothetical protein
MLEHIFLARIRYVTRIIINSDLGFIPIVGQQATDLEEVATKYYCQQFYLYFGRAAQVPHRLFPMDLDCVV